MTVYRFVGKDAHGIHRVFATANTETEAVAECYEAAIEYVGRHPDTGPLSGWRIEWESVASVV